MPIDSIDFADSYQQNYSRTVRLLHSHGLRGDVAQEFAQRAWARAWERRADLRQPSRLPEWVNSIAINGFRSWLRRSTREHPLQAGESPETASLVTRFFLQELLRSSKTYGHILELFYIWGFSAEEIADTLHTTPLAIRVRLSRGRAALRSQFSGTNRK